MSGYNHREDARGRGGRGGGYDSSQPRENYRLRDDNGQERRRSLSPGRGGRDFRGQDQGNGRGQKYYGGDHEVSNLPPLPREAPFPTGTGCNIPYPETMTRGTVGQVLPALVNHFQILTLPIVAIYEYQLKFRVPENSQLRGSEKVTANQMARVLLNFNLKNLLGDLFVFEGTSLGFSPELLVPIGEIQRTVISIGERKDKKPNEVEVAMKNKGPMNIGVLVNRLQNRSLGMDPMGNTEVESMLKWLNCVYRDDPMKRMTTRPNHNAFFNRSKGTSLPLESTGGILEAVRGIHQTMQYRFGLLTLNVDTVTAPFWVPERGLIDCVCALMSIRNPRDLSQHFLSNPGQFFQACSKLLGMYFNVRHLNENKNSKKYKFLSWTKEDALGTKFECSEFDTEISVRDYYERKYNLNLRYPELPLARSRNGDFPLELCFTAPGERYRAVLEGGEASQFIKFATCPATVRRQQIEENLKILSWHSLKIPKAHGLSVSPKMMSVKARILPSPRVLYGNKIMDQFRDGRWNLRGLEFLKPATIKSWTTICFSGRHVDEGAVERLGGELIRGFRSVGMKVPSSPPVIIIGNPNGNITKIIHEAASKANGKFGITPDVVFILTQDGSSDLYRKLKAELDTQIGFPSQVMQMDKAKKCQQQYIANVALKVNVKLGGINAIMEDSLLKNTRWMFIGGDISMPSPSALRLSPPPPSTAAMAATYDKDCAAYTSVATMQDSTQAKIVNAKAMFRELGDRYAERNNNSPPDRIIYYRDGTSEAEFKQLMEGEVQDLRATFPDAKITVIVSIKRHHTRIFPGGSYGTKLGNVPSGTVVENGNKDFFLVAQPELQGTKRPTRYAVLQDENQLSNDNIQRLTYGICFAYARATVSVSLAPPVYYAHQACERARLHLRGNVSGSGEHLPSVHERLKWNMYWQ